jgi:hypothetical protein
MKILDVYNLLKEYKYDVWNQEERETIYTLTDEYFEYKSKIFEKLSLLVGKENAVHIVFEATPKNYKRIVDKYLHSK